MRVLILSSANDFLNLVAQPVGRLCSKSLAGEVWLQTTLNEIQRKTRFSKAQFEEVSNGVFMRGDVEDLPWLACFLAGLGVHLVIHHPPELRTALRDYALLLASYAEQEEH